MEQTSQINESIIIEESNNSIISKAGKGSITPRADVSKIRKALLDLEDFKNKIMKERENQCDSELLNEIHNLKITIKLLENDNQKLKDELIKFQTEFVLSGKDNKDESNENDCEISGKQDNKLHPLFIQTKLNFHKLLIALHNISISKKQEEL